MKQFIAIILLLPIFLSGCQTQNPETPPSLVQEYFENSTLKAAVLGAIDREGHTTWQAFGPSNWADSTSIVDNNSIFRLFSMTKAITAVAAMQVVEKGLIGLDDPLNELLPEMAVIPILEDDGTLTKSDETITLRHLLTNTSGFGVPWFSSKLFHFNPGEWPYKDKPRLFQPGTGYAYGSGYYWAGKMIEKLSGQDLETYFRKNITGPLQMNATWFNVPDELREKIVTLGKRDSLRNIAPIQRIPQEVVTDFNGGSQLFGSPADYAIFLRCILNYGKYEGGQLLKQETVALMLKDNLPTEIRIAPIEKFEHGDIIGYTGDQFELMNDDRWGMGWYVEKDTNDIHPVNSVYWSGAANSYYTLDPSNGIAVLYFSNYLPANDKTAFDFYKLFEKEVYDSIHHSKENRN